MASFLADTTTPTLSSWSGPAVLLLQPVATSLLPVHSLLQPNSLPCCWPPQLIVPSQLLASSPPPANWLSSSWKVQVSGIFSCDRWGWVSTWTLLGGPKLPLLKWHPTLILEGSSLFCFVFTVLHSPKSLKQLSVWDCGTVIPLNEVYWVHEPCQRANWLGDGSATNRTALL